MMEIRLILRTLQLFSLVLSGACQNYVIPESLADGLIFHGPGHEKTTTPRIPIISPTNIKEIGHRTEGLLFHGPGNENIAIEVPNKPSSEGLRISRQRCLEYSKCVIVPVHSLLGGEAAKLGEFPYMAAVGWTGDSEISWICGGSLVSEQFVLTAGHCCYSKDGHEPDVVRVGELDIRANERQDIAIETLILHPEFKPPSRYNDIALLKLIRPITISIYIRPLCLWPDEEIDVKTATATGWGKVKFTGPRSYLLQKVDLTLVGNTECQKSFAVNPRTLSRGIIPKQLCAGNSLPERDTCSGDSGGPLTIKYAENKCLFHQVGITSFGIGCGSPNIPGVYTRVSSYLDWIESIVWPPEAL